MAPSDAAAMPLPNEDTTPPVTKTNLVMERQAAGKPNNSRKGTKPPSSGSSNLIFAQMTGAP
jgi:hypothetical protein